MTLYTKEPENIIKSGKACWSYLRVHFKNAREADQAIKDMRLKRADHFSKNVIGRKECVPFRRFCGGGGGVRRCAQAKHRKAVHGRQPKKSAEFLLQILKNAERNAEFKVLSTEDQVIDHI